MSALFVLSNSVYLKMYFPSCVFMSILLLIADGFTVKGSSGPLVVPLGGSVLLPCSVDSLLSLKDLEVQWRRSDSQTLIHLYQDGDMESFDDRAHFFTDNFRHGNFSLLLKHVTLQDKGRYTCTVHSGHESHETVLEISLKGLSGLHIMVLILCISACGSALLFCSLIYCRSNNTVLRLQLLLVFCPNIFMCFAFVFFGVSEGSVYEAVCCCALYVVRPLMLLWTAPYVQQFTGIIKTWILVYSYDTEYIVFSSVLYSVLFHLAWGKSLNYAGFEALIIKVLFVLALLFYLFYSIYMFGKISGKLSELVIKILNVLANIFLDVLPSLQLILMFYSFGSDRGGLFIVAVLPVILTATRWNWDVTCGRNVGCSPLVMRSVWFVMMLLVTTVMMFFYTMALEKEKDRVGWACMMGFVQVLWTIWNFSLAFEDTDFPRVITVYVFGSVGVVLISAVAMMTELILKTINGEGPMGDLRIVTFSCETLFISSVLIFLVFAPWIKPFLGSCQKSDEHSNDAPETPATDESKQNKESLDMNPLLNKQKTNRSEEETQPQSVESQTSETIIYQGCVSQHRLNTIHR